eukprot:symbB.v1.2.028584.t1/scaffold3042.1/size64827/2
MCSKSVVEKGGVYCGRKRALKDFGGCFQAICWKCMNKQRDKIGKIKTTKSEFASLGPDAWWMHETCMTPEDKKEYFREDEEEEEEEVKPKRPKKKLKDVLLASTRVRGLLRCLDAAFFVASFEEEGYHTVGDLREDGEEVVRDFVTALSMPRGIDEEFMKLSFQEGEQEKERPEDPARPVTSCGSMDPRWLDAVAPLYSMHMGIVAARKMLPLRTTSWMRKTYWKL